MYFKRRASVLGLVLVLGLLFSVLVAPAIHAGGPHSEHAKGEEADSSFDMNDRFSGSGASGQGDATIRNGELFLSLGARGLDTNHPYEVLVVIGSGNAFGGEALFVFPVTSSNKGKFNLKIRRFDLFLGSGDYRVDFLVVEVGDPNPSMPLLACEPWINFTIE